MYRILFANSDSSSDGAFSGFIFALNPLKFVLWKKLPFWADIFSYFLSPRIFAYFLISNVCFSQ